MEERKPEEVKFSMTINVRITKDMYDVFKILNVTNRSEFIRFLIDSYAIENGLVIE